MFLKPLLTSVLIAAVVSVLALTFSRPSTAVTATMALSQSARAVSVPASARITPKPRKRGRVIFVRPKVRPRTSVTVVQPPKPVVTQTSVPTPTHTYQAPVVTPTPTPTPVPAHTVAPAASGAAKAVAFAYAQIGCPYVYGGTGPCASGFDCSGLVQAAWRYAGTEIPRTSYEQYAGLLRVSLSALEPGDILVFSGAGHVGLYIGNGYMIDAPNAGRPVEKVPLEGYWDSQLIGAVRP